MQTGVDNSTIHTYRGPEEETIGDRDKQGDYQDRSGHHYCRTIVWLAVQLELTVALEV